MQSKKQNFDLEFKGQGHGDLICVCDTPPCPNDFILYQNSCKREFWYI